MRRVVEVCHGSDWFPDGMHKTRVDGQMRLLAKGNFLFLLTSDIPDVILDVISFSKPYASKTVASCECSTRAWAKEADEDGLPRLRAALLLNLPVAWKL